MGGKRGIGLVVAVIASVAAMLPAEGAIAPPVGRATAQNTILAVSAGSTSISLGTDSLQSLWGRGRQATAEMVVGTAGTTTIPGARRAATKRSDSGSADIGTGSKTITGIATASVLGGGVSADVASDKVVSAATLQLGSLDLLTGLAGVSAATTTTNARVDRTSATVTRTVTLGSADLLSIGDLLERLGVGPLSLGCAAVESAGAELGISTSSACEQLAAAGTAIDDATAALDAAKAAAEALVAGFTRSVVEADKATVEALSCDPLDLVCEASALATITGLNGSGGYGVDLTGLVFDDAKAAMLARFSAILEDMADLDVLNGGVAAAAPGTCDAVSGALAAVEAGVPALAAALATLRTAVDTGCDAVAGTLDELMATSLLSLGTVNVSLEATATATTSSSKVSGSVLALKVGTLAPAGATISVLDGVASATASVRDAVADVVAALGIGLGAPELELMKSSTAKGKKNDGTRYANASLTALHLRIPSATVTLPDTPPFGILSGTAGFDAPVRAGGARAPVTTPAIQVDAARFTGASSFAPGSDGKTLPVTGVPGGPVRIALAFAFTGAAVLLRRALRAD